MKKPWTRLTEAQKQEVVAAYEAGEHSTTLARRFGVSMALILSTLHKSEVKLRSQPMTEQDIGRAKKLYAQGCALSQLAEVMPFSQEAVRKALIKSGVMMRPARRG